MNKVLQSSGFMPDKSRLIMSIPGLSSGTRTPGGIDWYDYKSGIDWYDFELVQAIDWYDCKPA